MINPDHESAFRESERILKYRANREGAEENLARCYLHNREQLGDARATVTRKLKDELAEAQAERDALREALSDVIVMRGASFDLWGKEWNEWVRRNDGLLEALQRMGEA